jgi:hypothetical protein
MKCKHHAHSSAAKFTNNRSSIVAAWTKADSSGKQEVMGEFHAVVLGHAEGLPAMWMHGSENRTTHRAGFHGDRKRFRFI